MADKKSHTAKAESLLVELLTEELPPKALKVLGQEFALKIRDGLAASGLVDSGAAYQSFATPRRLAVEIPGVLDAAPNTRREVQGPSVSAPPQAVEGFAKKCGVPVDALKKQQTPKGEVYFAQVTTTGQKLADVLAGKIEAALKALPVPKVMRWGTGDAQFARPVHGLVMMHGASVIPGEVLGIASGNHTLGHRFLSSGQITIKSADDYEQALLKNGKVIADYAVRRSEIVNKINILCGDFRVAVAGDALYDEITALVEAPTVYEGSFSADFLEVPEECLVLSMQQHQKYVPLRDKATGKLLPRFLFVSNIETKQPGEIIHGNERVLRARLSDAKFFYAQDRKTRLEDRIPRLSGVVYHNKLGSQLERVDRIRKIASAISSQLKIETASTERAAVLSKADLLTDMVGEFPELQGIMGRYYALHDDEPTEIADAIEQHYRPRFAGDHLPETSSGCALALADKLYAITGIFAAGQQPTGDKDPFGLRRQALGVIRILVEKELNLRLQFLVDIAIAWLPNNLQVDWLVVSEFLLDRARSYFSDQGCSKQAIESVIQPFGANSALFSLREVVAEASRFIATDEGKILAEANKRITNILKKSGFEVPFGLRPDQLSQKPETTLFKEKAEKEFWKALLEIGGKSVQLRNDNKFAESLRVLSQLGAPTKTFFEDVLVNTEDPTLRDNRITLLQHARAYMNQVAELSLMAQ